MSTGGNRDSREKAMMRSILFSASSVTSCSKYFLFPLRLSCLRGLTSSVRSMSSVSHLRKRLDAPPATFDLPGIAVRNIEVTTDVASWLKLRQRAIAWLKPAARSWTADDFQAEMASKSWWHAEHTWLAVADEVREPRLVGSVTLAARETSTETIPVVHWLLVDPVHRRRGIGRLLISHLEQAVWQAGWQEVQLETHVRWAAAAAFYHSIGYEPLRAPSPR